MDGEWKDWSGAKVELDENDRDSYMANMFLNSFKNENGKAIIHTGFTHALEINWKMGYYLHQEYGDRIFQICLHHNFDIGDRKLSRKNFYISRFIDEIYNQTGRKSVGFDIGYSPFASIKDDVSDFFNHDFNTVYGTITDGYIIFRPLKDMRRTPFVNSFIDHSNFEKAKEIIRTRGWFKISDEITIEELNKKLTGFWSFNT